MAGDELLVKSVLLEGGEESKAAQHDNALLAFRWTALYSCGIWPNLKATTSSCAPPVHRVPLSLD